MSDRDEFGAFFIGFLVGGLTGAAVSLLLAPKSGEETRTILKDKAIELRDRATETAQTAAKQAEEIAGEARTKLDEFTSVAKSKVGEVQKRGQVVLEEKFGKKSEVVPELPPSES